MPRATSWLTALSSASWTRPPIRAGRAPGRAGGRPGAAAEDLRETIEELRGPDRLGGAGVGPVGTPPVGTPVLAGGRQQDHAEPPGRGVAPDGPHQVEAVGDGHLQVHEGGLVRRALGRGVEDPVHGGLGAPDGVGHHAPRGRQPQERVPAGRVVVHDQDPGAGGPVGPREVRPRPGPRLGAELEPEGRPSPGLRGDAGRPAHQLGELPRDRRAEPRAAESAGGGGVGLRERVEEVPAGLGGDAGSRVADLDPDGRGAPARAGEARPDHDLAALGELHGVAGEVQENLADPAGIAAHPPGQVGVHARDQLETLVPGPAREDVAGVLHHVAQPEVHLLELETARLDLREVQDVVDDVEERLGRAEGGSREPPRPLGEVAPLEEVQRPDDAVHGSPDLVAHVGQEARLDPARLLGLPGELHRPPGRQLQLGGPPLDETLEVRLVVGQLRAAGRQPPRHRVEGPREVLDLVPGVRLHDEVEAPGGHRLRRLDEGADGRRDPPGERDGGGDGRGEDERGDGDAPQKDPPHAGMRRVLAEPDVDHPGRLRGLAAGRPASRQERIYARGGRPDGARHVEEVRPCRGMARSPSPSRRAVSAGFRGVEARRVEGGPEAALQDRPARRVLDPDVRDAAVGSEPVHDRLEGVGFPV
jgi:hypothetical protein